MSQNGALNSSGGAWDWAGQVFVLARCNISPLGQAKPVGPHSDPQFWAVSPLPPFDLGKSNLLRFQCSSVYAIYRGFLFLNNSFGGTF